MLLLQIVNITRYLLCIVEFLHVERWSKDLFLKVVLKISFDETALFQWSYGTILYFFVEDHTRDSFFSNFDMLIYEIIFWGNV